MSTWLIRLALILQTALVASLLWLLAAGPATPRAHPAVSFLFLSANTDESLTLTDARDRLGSPEQRQGHELVGDILLQLGVTAHTSHDAVGDWGGGVENSVLATVQDPMDARTLEYAAGWFGLMARQKCVLAFCAGDGPDAVVAFEVGGSLPVLRARLDRSGVRERTLVPVAGGHRVVVFDPGSGRLETLRRLAQGHGTPIRVVTGTGLFVGAGSRLEAQAAYREVIRRYETTPGTRRYRPQAGRAVHPRPECVSTLWISLKPRTETPDEPGPLRATVPAGRGAGRGGVCGTRP